MNARTRRDAVAAKKTQQNNARIRFPKCLHAINLLVAREFCGNRFLSATSEKRQNTLRWVVCLSLILGELPGSLVES
jgi:hypothetical protein